MTRFMVHESFKDVFIEVCYLFQSEGYRKLTVRWWNLGVTGNPWLCEWERDRIKIPNAAWNKWKPFNPETPLLHPGRQEQV